MRVFPEELTRLWNVKSKEKITNLGVVSTPNDV